MAAIAENIDSIISYPFYAAQNIYDFFWRTKSKDEGRVYIRNLDIPGLDFNSTNSTALIEYIE